MDQVEKAVAFALDPSMDSSLKSQAIDFCEQVRLASDGWQLCLALFVRFPKSTPEARMFALQVLEDVLQNRFNSLQAAEAHYIRTTLMDFVKSEYVIGNGEEGEFSTEPPYLKNKFAHSLTLLFLQLYTSSWRGFFDEFLLFLRTNTTGTKKTNARAIDLFLRVLTSIDEEVANIVVPRGKDENNRNTIIKDTMRIDDVQKITSILYELLKDYSETNKEIVESCLKIIGYYIAWIDISLIVNEAYISLLYQFLGDPRFRIAACECLTEIVYKGMKPLDKLKLIQILNLTEIMVRLDLSDDIDFVEHVAKLTNVLGAELCKIWEETDHSSEAKSAAYEQIVLLLPFLLKFLGDEYDDTSSAVFSFVTGIQSILKKQKKKKGELDGSQREFLATLLNVVVIKMRYDDETEWGGIDEDGEEEAQFLEIRKSLKGFLDAAWKIDEPLFTTYVHSAVISTLNNYQIRGNEIGWREFELALHLLYLYGEAQQGQLIYFHKQNNEIVGITPLGEMVLKMVESNISAYPHPSIPLYFFENAVRYYQFFETRSDLIPVVLQTFVDTRGLHHSNKQIRSRSCYLFHRFIKSLKSHMNGYVATILPMVQDLMIVRAELPPMFNSGNNIWGKDQAMNGAISDQIYLFEAVGTLITVDSIPSENQLKFAEEALNPFLAGMQQSLNVDENDPNHSLSVLQLHHLIMAIGSIGKGFPDAPKGQTPNVPWFGIFRQSTEATLVVLKRLDRFEIIRDAARFAFARFVNVMGTEILPYIPSLINGLLNESQVSELIDFLPFIGLIAHKFKPSIFSTLDNLILPLVNKVFLFLNQAPSGTDEALLLMDLRRAYLSFLLNLFNYGMEATLITELNRPHLETILQTVINYVKEVPDSPLLRTSFSILSKAISSWGGGLTKSSETDDMSIRPNGIGQSLPGFDRFMYEQIFPICFELPMKSSFNRADGQTVLVLSEICGILKTMLLQQDSLFVDYLKNVLFPSMNCPSELAEEFIQALRQLEVKALRKYFQSFIQKFKS
ncbi:hypothetical protein G9A89_014981 [Geosiphon pyriformis]|nr:hypothetical protein G9A89_014981 [Geosiphon pyriformis]